jgi:hypothetical protein
MSATRQMLDPARDSHTARLVWIQVVAGFRLYCPEGGRNITHRKAFDADDDQAAIAYARSIHPGITCEIRELGRKVAVIPAGQTVLRQQQAAA